MTMPHNTPAKVAEGYQLRPATFDDIPALTAFFNARDRKLYGRDTTTEENLRNEWETPNFDVARSTRVVVGADDIPIAYIECHDIRPVPVRPFLWLCIDPAYAAALPGKLLLDWGIERAHEVIDQVPEHARVVIESGAEVRDEVTARVLTDAGFVNAERSFYKMAIQLEAEPTVPALPAGFTIRHALVDDDSDMRAIYAAKQAAFQDHRGHVDPASDEEKEKSYQRWLQNQKMERLFDKSLWYLLMDGDTIAGISLCREESWDHADQFYVMVLGVVREYRRRGLAQALLYYTFKQAWQQGKRAVSLHVDGSSLTGATRVYARVGMAPETEFRNYELEIRPGEELTKQD